MLQLINAPIICSTLIYMPTGAADNQGAVTREMAVINIYVNNIGLIQDGQGLNSPATLASKVIKLVYIC